MMEDQKHPSYSLTTQECRENFASHLSSHYLADEVTLTISNRYSPQAVFFPSLLPPSAFSSLNPFPFKTRADTLQSKGIFISEHLVSVLRVMFVGSCPHPTHAAYYLKQQYRWENCQGVLLLLWSCLKNMHFLTLFTLFLSS